MGSFRRAACSLITVSILIFVSSVSFASVPGIVGQDEGGIGNSPVSFNMGESSEMSGGHKVNVNVTTGNLTVKHTDLVIPTKAGNIVIERTYNSLQHLNGVEEGLEVQPIVGGYDPNDNLYVSPGVVWINGERVIVTDPDPWPLPYLENDQSTGKTIYVKNLGGGIGSVIFDAPGNETDRYAIGIFTVYRDESVYHYSLSNTGHSLNTGVEYGAHVTSVFHEGSGDSDDEWDWTLNSGAVRIKGKTYRVNEQYLGQNSIGHYNKYVVLSPGANDTAAVSTSVTYPTNTQFPEGYVVVNSFPSRSLDSSVKFKEHKLGTGGKWKFNFESYAVNNGGNLEKIMFKSGGGTVNSMELSGPVYPKSGHTDKRAYYDGKYDNDYSLYSGFELNPNMSGEKYNYFERASLKGVTSKYRGFRVPLPNNQVRDDAILTERIDANNNKLVYEWRDGPNGKFAGLDGSDTERDYYIERIYDDLAGGDGNPDSIQVLFTYTDATKAYISSVVVTDASGSYREVVAEYEYQDGVLTDYTDFQGRSFIYHYGGDDRLIAIEDQGDGFTTFAYECATKKVSQLRSPRFYPDEYEEYTVACPPSVPAEPAATLLSIPSGDGGGLNKDYSYYWADRKTVELAYQDDNLIGLVDQAEIEYTWDADIRANTNLLEDRRITNKVIMNHSDSAIISSTTWTYNPTTVMVTSKTDGNNNTTSYQYNSKRQVTQKTYSGGSTELFTYDGSDNLGSRTDRNWNTTDYDYTDSYNPHLVTGITYKVDGMLKSKGFTYSPEGLLESKTDSEGHETLYSHDIQGQVTTVSYSRVVDGQSTQVFEHFSRDVFGRLLASTDAGGHTVSYTYDMDRYHRYLTEKSESLEINGAGATPPPETYEYDILGNLTQVTDYEGGVTKYGYDADGLVTSIWKGSGPSQGYTVSKFAYDTTGKVVQKSQITGTGSAPQWHTTEVHRNAAGWVTSTVEKNVETDQGLQDLVTSYYYDPAGNLVNKVLPMADGQDSTWSYSYDEVNRLVAVEEPGVVNRATYTYDDNGNLTGYIDPELNTASFTYNEINKVSEAAQPDRETKHFSYNGEGRVTASWEETMGPGEPVGTVYTDGGTSRKYYRPVGKYETSSETYNMQVAVKIFTSSELTFDKVRVFIKSVYSNPGYDWTVSLRADFLTGSVLTRDDGSDAVVTIPAPTTSQEWFEIDIGQGTTITADSNFWIIFQRVGNSSALWYLGYNGTSSSKPSANKQQSWDKTTYKIGVQLEDTITMVFPEPTHLNGFVYNPEGTLASASLADGQALSYQYNKRGQPTQSVRIAKNLTEVDTNYTYYPESGWLQTKTTGISTGGALTIGYKYNALGQVREIDHPGSDIAPIEYQYTSDGFHWLSKVTDSVTDYVSSINYDLAGRPTAYTFANGFTETIARDSLGRPESLTIFDPVASVNRFLETYAWDARGNLDSRGWETRDASNTIIDGDTDSMSYDPNDRLWSVESGSHVSYYYSYDGAGNQQWDPLGGSGQTGSFQYDSVNRMTQRNFVNGDYLEFDWVEADGRSRGNLVTKTLKDSGGNPLSTEALYTWSEDNLLLRADTPNIGYSDYLYDAGGDRIHKLASQGIETFYVFNGLNVAYEFEDSLEEGTTTRYYIHALGRHMASVEIDDLGAEKTYFFHADYLGSVRMISDDNALVVWQKRYAPFGGDEEQSGTIENTYQFTGKGWDEDSQLFYFNARWYDADVGRFISEDPLWGNILDPQSLNRFAYGRNNPFRFTDPTGLEDENVSWGNSDHDEDPSDPSTYNRPSGGGDVDSKESCNIQVRFNSVSPTAFLHGYLLTYQGYKPGVNSWYFRGGPQAASGFPPQLTTNYGPYVPNTPDYNLQSGTQPFMDPIQISESCDSINDTLVDLMEDIDNRGLNYLGITQNSNAVWAEGYKSFGGNPTAEIHNNYGWGAPGRKDTLPGYNINDYFNYGGVAP